MPVKGYYSDRLLGNVIPITSTVPYSGRQTCGTNACHDINRIANGFKFQQGRTDLAGNIIMKDDYYGDGRWFERSPGRYGMALPVGSMSILAGKENANESAIDLTTFAWVRQCGACHPGGGPGEFDRDGVRLYDQGTGQFGYEVLGKTAEQVALDGDYTVLDPATGNLSLARWHITGLSEPDCLLCHTPDPRWDDTVNVDRVRTWRSATVAAQSSLVDSMGRTVPAYAAAGPAGQGWFSTLTIQSGVATTLQIDYFKGVERGSLVRNEDDTVGLPATSVDRPPRDKVCWNCHKAAGDFKGEVWFDQRIVHYKKFNKLRDDDPSNDVSPRQSRVCNYCHRGNLDHEFAKGNAVDRPYRDELDYVNMKTCRDCHLTELPNGEPNPRKHPDAPDVPGSAEIHLITNPVTGRGPFDIVSCQACHIPYALLTPVRLLTDSAATGVILEYTTDAFYSADPLNPSSPDKSRWYPRLDWKVDSDGVSRLFPNSLGYYRLYWADWDQHGTPEDRSDDAIAPIAIWRLRQITRDAPLSVVTDDNHDGKPEVNRPEEILAYITALKGNDSYGRQVAANPVLVKGYRIWYEDPQAPEGISSFDPSAMGIVVKFDGKRELSHDVLAKTESLGYNAVNPELGCPDCHRPATFDSPVFDRKILMDPWGPDGNPVYTTVRAMTGLNPP